MNITTHTKTITTINQNTNALDILCFSDLNENGGYDPSIYFSKVLEASLIIDNVSGIEGEALLGKVDENVTIQLNEKGELLLNAYHEPSSRYRRGGTDDADLIYDKPDFIPEYNDEYNDDYYHEQNHHTVDNLLANPGDTIIINVNSIVTGKITLTSFESTFTGPDSPSNVLKTFRISLDGIFWSEWKELTNENLLNIQHIVENEFNVQIKCVRNIPASAGDIVFKNFHFGGLFEVVDFSMPTIEKSMFAGIINTPEFLQLEKNIFKKLYFRGIIPEYIKRAENRSYSEDEDYIELTKSIARFFTMIFIFFKRWEKFPENPDMLREQLNSYGINFDESNITFEQLKYLCENIYGDIGKRGTSGIFNRKGKVLPNLEEMPVDGELVRLLKSTEADELIYEIVPNNKAGWCLGQCSPLYKGTCESKALNKTRENTPGFQDLNNFVTCGNVRISDYDSKNGVLKALNNGDNNVYFSGLGRVSDKENVSNKLYPADANLDYEITFTMKLDVIEEGQGEKSEVWFGVEGFNINKVKFGDAFSEINGFNSTEYFFKLPAGKFSDKFWYKVRGIIHAYNSENSFMKTNIGYGSDLVFNNPFTKYILPKIQIHDSGSYELNIYDYKIRPLVRGENIIRLKNGKETARSLGFIECSPLFYTYARSNNNNQSVDTIIDIIEKYLYNYNTLDLFTILSNF